MLRPLGKFVIVFKEPQQENSRSGLVLPDNKICHSRRVRVLAVGKDCDPDIKPGGRYFAYSFDSVANFKAPFDTSFPVDKELNVEYSKQKFPEKTSVSKEYRNTNLPTILDPTVPLPPPVIEIVNQSIEVQAGAELHILGQSMIQFGIDEQLILSDQREFE